MRSVNQMFVRAEETLRHTHYRLRCWLQTYHQRHFRPIAFDNVRTTRSRIGYISIWKHFICYIFRVWAIDERLREEIYSVNFRELEAGQMEYIWSTLLEDMVAG
jgi:hypothetical protein